MKRLTVAAVAALALASCARLQKPNEMQSFEGARKTRAGEELNLAYPELVKRADAEHRLAAEALDDKEKEDLDYHARVAWLWWQSAQLRSDAATMKVELTKVEEERAKLDKDLAEAKKRQKLAKASLDRMKELIALEGKVAGSQEVSAAKSAINEALAALKEAQAVDADVHASASFAAAEGKLKAATDALGKNKTKDAVSYAIEAKATAESAAREASPKFSATEADQARMAKQRAVFDAVGQISGVSRSMVEGGVQAAVVEVFGASGSSVNMLPGMEATFVKLAQTSKQFPEYALVIEAHTDSKGNKTKNLTLSESRAKSVMAFLAAQGVPPDKMTALGKGSTEPVADNKTKEGRAKNRRVEILFVPSSR